MLGVAIASCLLPTAATLQAQETPGPAADELLIGADWLPDAPEATKQLFYEAGFSLARVTGGGYDWAVPSHEKAVAELEAHGVKVLLQLGSHYPSAAYFRFRDSWFVDQAGNTGEEDRNAWAITYSGQHWPQYSYASEEIREQFEKDFTQYLSALKQHRNVAGIILHNEPGLLWLRDRLFDYSAPALRAFRAWLKGRYGEVGRLNEAWGSRFGSFDTVEPPRQLPPVESMAAWLDWRRANVAMIHDFLQWEIGFARRAWPGMPLMTNMAGPMDAWYPMRCADNFLDSEGFDVAGIDIYPTQWTRARFQAYAMDMTRGVARGRPVYVLECEVFDGGHWAGLSEAQRADMLRASVWSHIGHGARAISLWSLTDRGGFALTNGEFNPRVAAMREVTHLARMLDLGAFRVPARRIAVVVDPDSFLYYGGLEKDPPWFLDKSGLGMSAALADAGHESDVIFAEQVRRGEALGYRALLLSVPVMMDDALAARLTEFVRGGGLLIAEAPFAEVDASGRECPTKPGCGLDAVFGIRGGKSGRGDPGVIEADGAAISGWGFRSDVQPAGAEVVGRFADGRPAVTRNAFGKGQAVYIASCVSFPYGDGWAQPGLSEFLKALIRAHAVESPLTVTHSGKGFLDAAMLEDGRGNRVVVLTVPPGDGKPAAPVTDVEVSLAPGLADGLAGALGFLPTQESDGAVRNVSQSLPVEREGEAARLRLGTVESAAVVLLARDMPPLLGLQAPAAIGAGGKFTVTVTCTNASPRAVTGALDLVLPEAAKALTPPARLVLEPRASRSVALEIQAPAAPVRLVIKARFAAEGSDPITSVPVDVYVK
jgi:beta-galactosidase GanA